MIKPPAIIEITRVKPRSRLFTAFQVFIYSPEINGGISRSDMGPRTKEFWRAYCKRYGYGLRIMERLK